jgi:DNA polymerase I
MVYSDWRQLPFAEIWAVDTEFYPGPGLANGGRDGDAPTPLCIVAIEMRSGRAVRLWQDELTPFPPYRLDADAVMWGYMNTAEFGFHLAGGWGKPAYTLDAYIEHRHYVNNGAMKAEDRDKGFYSLAGALRYFCEDDIDTAHKIDMRDRIIQGPPFSADEREQILTYCETDVRALMRLIPHLVPTIRSLPQALSRGDYTWLLAQQERRGVPIDLPQLEAIRAQWTRFAANSCTRKTRRITVTKSRTASRTGVVICLPTTLNAIAWPGRPTLTANSTSASRLSATWQAVTRRSRRCATFVIRCQSCG